MADPMLVELTLVGVGGALTAVSAATGLGVRRLLKSHDELKTSHGTLTKNVSDQAAEIAAMKVKLPNGEWRAITDGVAACTAGVQAVSMDVAALRGDLGKHILDETAALAETREVVSTCKGLLMAKPKRRTRR